MFNSFSLCITQHLYILKVSNVNKYWNTINYVYEDITLNLIVAAICMLTVIKAWGKYPY